MGTFANLDLQNNFWENYGMDGGEGSGGQNVMNGDLGLNDVTMGMLYGMPSKSMPPSVSPMMDPSNSFSRSSSTSNNNSVLGDEQNGLASNIHDSLSQLNQSIDQTQSKIFSIKQELSTDGLPLVANGSTAGVAGSAGAGAGGGGASGGSSGNEAPYSNLAGGSSGGNSNSNSNGNGNGITNDKVVVDKRKHQNRAAQRAFRERKEQKLKQLEKQLEQSELEKKKVLSELKKLQMKNIIITTENQMLLKNQKATAAAAAAAAAADNSTNTSDFDSPMSSQHELYSSPALVAKHAKFTFPCTEETKNLPDIGSEPAGAKLVYTNPEKESEKLLSTAAVWDYLTSFETLNDVTLDIENIMLSLKGSAKCCGLGPAYVLEDVQAAILRNASSD